MKILVTGANGFLGSHLVRRLCGEGHAVVALRRSTSDLGRLGDMASELRWYDLDKGGLEQAFREHPALDAVIHTATCYGRNGESVTTVFEANTSFPLWLLELSADKAVPLFINTDTCFNNDAAPRYSFLQSHCISKEHFAEWGKMYADAGKIRFVNLKLQHPYGPGDGPNKFVPSIIRQCLTCEGEIKLTRGEQEKDFIYVADVVEAYLAVLARAGTLASYWVEYQCGTGSPTSIRRFVETVHQLTQSRAVLSFGALPYRANEIMRSCADIAGLKHLGWSPKRSLREGLVETLERDHALTIEPMREQPSYACSVR
jgi:nucleoside-diphosphate-sugar epimerase